jgi:hypothetical protein
MKESWILGQNSIFYIVLFKLGGTFIQNYNLTYFNGYKEITKEHKLF